MSLDFSKFTQEILFRLFYTPSEIEFLRRLRFLGGKYSEFAEVLKGLPECESNLLGIANKMFEGRVKEPLTSIEVALSMMGFVPARNFLAVSLLKKNVSQIMPGQPAVATALNFSLESEAAGGPFAPDYYVAGLVYDLLDSTLAPASEENPFKEKLSEIWEHGIELAGITTQLVKQLAPELGIGRDLCIDAILHDVGKFAYAVLTPVEYEQNRHINPPEALWMHEFKSCRYPHDLLGHLVLWRFGFLQDSSWVILFHHQPFLAKRMGKKIYARTALIWVADHLARYKKAHRSIPKDPVLANWFDVAGPALESCKKPQFEAALKSVRF